MEAHAGDLTAALSIGQLLRIANSLGVDPYWLIEGIENPTDIRVSPKELVECIKHVSMRTGLSIEKMEKEAGYTISSVLTTPDIMFDWNVDCLRSVCRIVNIEPGSILNLDSLAKNR